MDVLRKKYGTITIKGENIETKVKVILEIVGLAFIRQYANLPLLTLTQTYDKSGIGVPST